MAKHYAGARIRRLRSERGISQVELARRLDLSASYVNQLENDQRPLSAAVLMKLLNTFEVDASYFSGDADARLLADVQASLAGSGLGGGAEQEVIDMTARYPAIARHLIQLTQRLDEQSEQVAFLGQLATTASSDRTGSGALGQFAYERVRDFFYAHRNYIPELDVAAEDLATELGGAGSSLVGGLRDLLERDHGVRVVSSAPAPDVARRRFDPEAGLLVLASTATPGQRAFHMGVQLGFLRFKALLDDLVTVPELDDVARPVARIGLAQYFAGALLLPYLTFLQAARHLQFDVDLLAQVFGVGIETICHRLSTLQRPGARGVPFIFVRTDRAGNISKRQSATAFHFSRGGGSCPLWVVHRAFESPGQVVRQVAAMPDGRRYLWIARALAGRSRGYGRPVPEFAIGLGCAIEHADQLTYASGLDLTDPSVATPIGAGCRVCDRVDCVQRAFPHAGRQIVVSEDLLGASPYGQASLPGGDR